MITVKLLQVSTWVERQKHSFYFKLASWLGSPPLESHSFGCYYFCIKLALQITRIPLLALFLSLISAPASMYKKKRHLQCGIFLLPWLTQNLFGSNKQSPFVCCLTLHFFCVITATSRNSSTVAMLLMCVVVSPTLMESHPLRTYWPILCWGSSSGLCLLPPASAISSSSACGRTFAQRTNYMPCASSPSAVSHVTTFKVENSYNF